MTKAVAIKSAILKIRYDQREDTILFIERNHEIDEMRRHPLFTAFMEKTNKYTKERI